MEFLDLNLPFFLIFIVHFCSVKFVNCEEIKLRFNEKYITSDDDEAVLKFGLKNTRSKRDISRGDNGYEGMSRIMSLEDYVQNLEDIVPGMKGSLASIKQELLYPYQRVDNSLENRQIYPSEFLQPSKSNGESISVGNGGINTNLEMIRGTDIISPLLNNIPNDSLINYNNRDNETVAIQLSKDSTSSSKWGNVNFNAPISDQTSKTHKEVQNININSNYKKEDVNVNTFGTGDKCQGENKIHSDRTMNNYYGADCITPISLCQNIPSKPVVITINSACSECSGSLRDPLYHRFNCKLKPRHNEILNSRSLYDYQQHFPYTHSTSSSHCSHCSGSSFY